jgi:sulfite exporter TauE/SafE
VILGACLSMFFGFLSSFLGIGGGFLYVPTLVYLLGFPVHRATATSLFVLVVTSFTGTATHIAAGLFQHGVQLAVALSLGAIAGAQVAARLSAHPRRLDYLQPCHCFGISRVETCYRRAITASIALHPTVVFAKDRAADRTESFPRLFRRLRLPNFARKLFCRSVLP